MPLARQIKPVTVLYMRDIRNSIVVIVLVFVSVLMLIASLEYTSNIINAGSEPVDYHAIGDESKSDGSGVPSDSSSDATQEEKGGEGIDLAQLLGQGDEAKFDPFAAGQDPGPIMGIIVFVATVLAGTSAIVFWYTRKRRRKQAVNILAGPAEAAGVPTVPPGSFAGRYGLRFPQIREPFPLTWGADEPLEMAITCNGVADSEAVLSVDGGEARHIRLDGGIARVMLRLPKGRHRVTVGHGGPDVPGEASWTDVQIVDYREEIVRMFNELCRSLKSGNADVRDDMTPRELERTICERKPETVDSIGAAVTVFELANFSTHAVRRAEYERMYLSGMGL
jgi:hypothetical protein